MLAEGQHKVGQGWGRRFRSLSSAGNAHRKFRAWASTEAHPVPLGSVKEDDLTVFLPDVKRTYLLRHGKFPVTFAALSQGVIRPCGHLIGGSLRMLCLPCIIYALDRAESLRHERPAIVSHGRACLVDCIVVSISFLGVLEKLCVMYDFVQNVARADCVMLFRTDVIDDTLQKIKELGLGVIQRVHDPRILLGAVVRTQCGLYLARELLAHPVRQLFDGS